MKPKWYTIITRAIDEGVDQDWVSAHKHIDKPTPENIKTAIADAVYLALSEVIIWEEE